MKEKLRVVGNQTPNLLGRVETILGRAQNATNAAYLGLVELFGRVEIERRADDRLRLALFQHVLDLKVLYDARRRATYARIRRTRIGQSF